MRCLSVNIGSIKYRFCNRILSGFLDVFISAHEGYFIIREEDFNIFIFNYIQVCFIFNEIEGITFFSLLENGVLKVP